MTTLAILAFKPLQKNPNIGDTGVFFRAINIPKEIALLLKQCQY
jgi:hypothetical protein